MATIRGEIDTSVVPGTTHLVDVYGSMRTSHDAQQKDIILVPTPSNDPEDPLNWSNRRKQLQMFCIFIYCTFVGIASAAIYSVLVPIALETGLTLDDLNAGTGVMFLFFGWGCVVWQPLALQYGKRPVYLFSMLATLGIQMWSPYTKNKSQWIASKVLQGFFGAPIESLCEITVADLFFAHERGKYMALYALFLTTSNTIAPLLAGFILDGQGWRWVLYWPAIGCGLGFIILFFLMEETNYDRKTIGIVDVTERSDTSSDRTEKNTDVDEQPVNDSATPLAAFHKKTYWDKLKLIDKPRPNQMWVMMKRPFIFVSMPVIVYCGFAYGCTVVWSNFLNGTNSLILSSPPYSFKASIVGLFYLPSLIGIVVGCIFTGVLGDWFVVRLARRNNGILEAEGRLWLYVIPTICVPAALIFWGVGAAHSIHWFGLACAGFLLSASLSVTIILSMNYCVDTYKELAGEAMITVIVIRNTMVFGVDYAITPWITALGVQNTFVSVAFIALAVSLPFLAMIKWGKAMREASRLRYWRYVAEGKALGLSH